MRALPGLLALALVACSEPDDAFDRPTAVAFDPRTREVVVSDGYNHARIARFTREGAFTSELGRRGSGDGELRTPHGLAIDAAGRVYVADRENARVQVFGPDGALLAIWPSALVGRPWSVTVGPDARVYVVDGGDQDPASPRGAVVALTREGLPVARWTAPAGRLEGGHAIAVGRDGSVYVAEADGKRVTKLRRSP